MLSNLIVDIFVVVVVVALHIVVLAEVVLGDRAEILK